MTRSNTLRLSRLYWKKIYPLYASVSIMGTQLRAPLKPLNMIVLRWSIGFQGSPLDCLETPASRIAKRLIGVFSFA